MTFEAILESCIEAIERGGAAGAPTPKGVLHG